MKHEYEEYCPVCQSTEVARCRWVNVNTNTIYRKESGTTLEWCMTCEEQTNIKTRRKKK